MCSFVFLGLFAQEGVFVKGLFMGTMPVRTFILW